MAKQFDWRLVEYIKSRGVKPTHVAKKIHRTRQCISEYGKKCEPTLATLEKIAAAMTELGAPTTVVDLYNWWDENKPKNEM